MKTNVVNLLSVSGAGKSTAGAGLFYKLKCKGINTELVSEYVKSWAWRDIKPIDLDQAYFFGKQSHKERILYGKVDIIVTDSPLMISAFYESIYTKKDIITSAVFKYIDHVTENHNVVYHNYLFPLGNNFDARGRFESANQSKANESLLLEFLAQHKVHYTPMFGPQDLRVDHILEDLSMKGVI